MLTRTLTAIAAAVPSSVKYKMGWLRHVYTSVLAWHEPFVPVGTCVGVINWNVDALVTQQYIRAAYERYMQESFIKFLRPGNIVYDVGAHVGFHSLFCGLVVGGSGRVIAFEPDPVCRGSLCRQANANPSLPITVMPYALSDRNAQVRFFSSKSSGQSRIHDHGGLLIEARTTDSLVERAYIPPPDLMKIDVEGHEEAVLRGALATLSKCKPVILCDYNDGNTLKRVHEVLVPLGYQIEPGPPITATSG